MELTMHDLAWENLSARFRQNPQDISSVAEVLTSRIEETNPQHGAYVHTSPKDVIAKAERLAKELADGKERGPLHGIPFAVKDNYDTAGIPTEYGSDIYKGWIPEHTAHAVAKLEEAGALFVGKTRTHEFAMAAVTPGTQNPRNLEHIAGGSSGGSAAAVAAETCSFALGTDTGGSIRIPAALCGVVGLKPAFGDISRTGVKPLSWALDHAGPLAASVATAAVAYSTMRGFDDSDAGSRETASNASLDSLLSGGAEGIKVGIPEAWFYDRVDDDILRSVTNATASLERSGLTLQNVEVPKVVTNTRAIFWGIWFPEAAAVLTDHLVDRQSPFVPAGRVTLEAGHLVSAVDYIRALRLREKFITECAEMFEHSDVLVMPTVPRAAPKIGQSHFDVEGELEEVTEAYIRLCAPWNLAGFPAITVPGGVTSKNLPIGIQVVALPGKEEKMFAVARAIEALSK